MRIEEYLNVIFDESLPEPKSSSSVKDDRIDEPIVQDLNGSPSLQLSKSVLNNKAFEDSSSETDFNEDWYNIKDKGVDVVIPQTSSKEGEKESKALKLIKASNNRKRKAYRSKRAIAYMKLCKNQGEDNVQASPNYKVKIKM
ncbi:hypothetical protein Tco_0550127 [Tanacetum coccineum]